MESTHGKRGVEYPHVDRVVRIERHLGAQRHPLAIVSVAQVDEQIHTEVLVHVRVGVLLDEVCHLVIAVGLVLKCGQQLPKGRELLITRRDLRHRVLLFNHPCSCQKDL